MSTTFTYNNLTMINVNFAPSVALVADFENWSTFENQQLITLKKVALENNMQTTLLVFVNEDYNPGLWNQKNIEKLANKHEIDLIIFYVVHQMFHLSNDEEIYKNLANFLNVKKIVVGNNYQARVESRFTTNFFQKHWGPDCILALDYKDKEQPINLLELLNNSDFINFKKQTGLDFCFSGRVVEGKQKGRQIGFPTINLITSTPMPLQDGVYACEVNITGVEKTLFGAGFYWYNELEQKLFEIYLLDFNEDVYGRKVDVKLVRKIRGPSKFVNIDELIKSITVDVAAVRKVFK